MKFLAASTLSIGLLSTAATAANHGKPGQRHNAAALSKREGNGNHTLAKRDYSGMATFYNAETGQAGACGNFIKNSDWTVAIKGSMYGDYGQKSYWCGKSLVITGNGKTTTAVVADACPGCQGSGGLDMTPGLFSFFISQDAGVMPITWHEAGAAPPPPPPPEPSSSKWTPPAPAWTPSSSSQWTPEWTPPSSSWTPEWTPSSSSQWTPEWTPSSSSSWTPSSTWSAPSSSWTPSSSSSSSWSHTHSHSASHNATSTGYNATSTATHLSNSTLSSVNATDSALSGSVNATTTLPTDEKAAATASSHTVGGTSGNLGRNAQIILDLAGLAYAAAPHK